MSSAVVSTSAAQCRPFLFDDDPESGSVQHLAFLARSGKVLPAADELKKPAGKQSAIAEIIQSAINHKTSAIPLAPASRLEIRATPEMACSGITELDALTGGLPRGCLTELCGPASSGRTSVMLAALAAATCRGEFCALIDASDALDPHSVAAAGVDLDHFLWVRCGDDSPPKNPRDLSKGKNSSPASGTLSAQKAEILTHNESRKSEHRIEQVLRATDLLLESGGFGLIVLDLADLPPQTARRIPLTTWFRFRRAVEYKPTILLAIEQQPIAGSCSSLLLQLGTAERHRNVAHGASRESQVKQEQAWGERTKSFSDCLTHTHLLSGLEIKVERIRSRFDRKPAHSVTFATQTAWTG